MSVTGIGLPGVLYLRFHLDGTLGELFLEGGGMGAPITAGHLRGIPLANIAAVALSRPDLFVGPLVDPNPPELLPILAELVPFRRRSRKSTETAARLQPPTAGLTDEFLQRVAHAYTAAVARGERPNKSLAEQTQTPQRTVERWVYLARKKGLLPPTRRGGVA